MLEKNAIKKNFGQKNKIDFIFSCLIYKPLPPLPIQCWREECWREGVYCIFNQHWMGRGNGEGIYHIPYLCMLDMQRHLLFPLCQSVSILSVCCITV